MSSVDAQPDTGSSGAGLEATTRILLPLSGAEKDERAVPVAARLAERLGLELTLMSAVSDEVLESRLRRYLERVDETVEGPTTSITVVQGPNPLKTIVAECGEGTLPVMATSGRLLIHDTYLGSAGAWVVRESHHPVVLVGPDCVAATAFDVERVIVPVDGSPLGDRAVDVGVDWARKLGVPLWLVTVFPEVEPPEVEKAVGHDATLMETNHLRSLCREVGRKNPDLDMEWDSLHGRDAARAIVDYADGAALICMGSHGRTGLPSIAMGSVARKVVRQAVQPVVVRCCPEIGSPG